MSWRAELDAIRALLDEIALNAPYRDVARAPHAPAERRAVVAAERRVGRRLPPSYRAFLAESNGWPRFFDGAALLGADELGREADAELARSLFEAATTPVPDLGAPRTTDPSYSLIPFGVDAAQTTLFAFDPTSTAPDGEMAVVAWIGEIAVEYASFAEFLRALCELYAAELAESAPLLASA